MTTFLQALPEATNLWLELTKAGLLPLLLAVCCAVLWRAREAELKENDRFLKELLSKGKSSGND